MISLRCSARTLRLATLPQASRTLYCSASSMKMLYEGEEG